MAIIQHEFDEPTAKLEALTLDQYKSLAERGEVRQVSEPLTVRMPYGGRNVLVDTVRELGHDYSDANAYMAGLSAQTTGVLVTPVVFYHVDRK